MTFHEGSVWFLVLAVLLPLVWWRHLGRRCRPALLFSAIDLAAQQPRGWAVAGRHLLPALRTLTLALLIVCLARPQQGNQETRILAEGIAIQLIVDRSGSMQAMDFQVDGKPADRLTAVKDVLHSFVFGTGSLDGRPDDLVGLIVFGTFADSLCPLTLDHDHLIKTLDAVQIATTQEEGATAIGDAIALGVERLRTIEQQRHLDGGERIKSKIMILLTDGENNAGDFDPVQAAELAATFDIKIYTIGAGTRGRAPMPAQDLFGRRVMRSVPVNIDEDTLKDIASATGGQFFRATDTDSLQEVYARIDALEKTKIEEHRFMHYEELATAGVSFGGIRMPPLLLIVVLLLVVELILANTRFLKIP